jgi:hypothetical protein
MTGVHHRPFFMFYSGCVFKLLGVDSGREVNFVNAKAHTYTDHVIGAGSDE